MKVAYIEFSEKEKEYIETLVLGMVISSVFLGIMFFIYLLNGGFKC